MTFGGFTLHHLVHPSLFHSHLFYQFQGGHVLKMRVSRLGLIDGNCTA